MSHRTRTQLVAIACVISTPALPGVSHGNALGVDCLIAFGTTSPTDWCAEPHTGELTAVSRPFASSWSKGTLFVRGIASPGMYVEIIASDGVGQISVTVTSLPKADPSQHKPAGAFNAELQIAQLGTHAAESGADPTSFAGVSAIEVLALPTAADGARGRERRTVVTKYAATPRDVHDPVISIVRWPPSSWHPKSALLGQGASDGIVRGMAFDDPPEYHGRASEIAEITVTVKQGTRVLWRPDPSVFRSTSVRGQWNLLLKITDFQPNWTPGSERYVITVDVTDAWGNAVQISSPGITVYPV